MKRKAQSASVEDTDPQTEEPIPSTQNSASISPSAQESHLRRTLWRKSGQQHIYECHDSQDLGPVVDLISQADQEVLTIIAGAHNDNAEIWADCEASARKSSKKHRIFYLKDEIVNGESKTYIARTIPISAMQDLSAANPSLIIAQRRIPAPEARGSVIAGGENARAEVTLRAHRLHFGAAIDLERPYIFSRLGDETASIGGADLHITFRSLRDWETFLKRGSFGGWDRDVTVPVSGDEIREGKRVVWDFERGCRGGEGEGEGEGRPRLGIAVEAGGLAGLLGAEDAEDAEKGGGEGLTPRGKKRRVDRDGEGRSFCVKLIGAGPEIEGHPFRADINVKFVLKS